MNTSNLASALANTLWADLESGEDFPNKRPLLAHYTSVSTLEKIVSTDQVWLSNPLYMNDLEELRFGMNAGANEFRSSQHLAEIFDSSERHAFLIEKFDEHFSNFDTNHVLDTYIMCLCEHSPERTDGLLSMWRGYGANGNGVAIVFETSKITPIESSPLIVGKVRYLSAPDRMFWIDSKLSELATVLSATKLTDEDLMLAAYSFIERLKIFALFTKHDGFSEEQEWRIVYMSERDTTGLMKSMFGYAITGRGVEPKLKLDFSKVSSTLGEGLSLDSLINRIILGPSISSISSATAVRRMLTVAGRSSLAALVSSSSIPYRPTTNSAA